MGLDMYLNASKRLNKKSKIDRQYIEVFNSISNPEIDDEEDGMYLSLHWGDGKAILEQLQPLPKIVGQVGDINTVKRDGDSYIIRTEAGYWRKANQIHNWFVENCQAGIDNCESAPISVEQLQTLQGILKSFGKLSSPPTAEMIETARQILPSASGFFFGTTTYDDWYFDGIKSTKRILRSVLKQSTINNWQLQYRSSW